MSLDNIPAKHGEAEGPTADTYLYRTAENQQVAIEQLLLVIDLSIDQSNLLLYAAKLRALYSCNVFIVSVQGLQKGTTDSDASYESIIRQIEIVSMQYFTGADRVQASVIEFDVACNDDGLTAANAINKFVHNNNIDLTLKTGCNADTCDTQLLDRSLINTLNCNLLFVPEVVCENTAVIIAAIDGNNEHAPQKALNRQVACWTQAMSNNLDCKVTAVSVINIELALQMLDATDDEPPEKTALKNRVLSLLNENNIDCAKVIISAGDPAKKILNNAHHQNASLVVIGSTDKDTQAPMFSSNTAEKVLRRIQIPLLIVKNHDLT